MDTLQLPSVHELLLAWERGANQRPAGRALTLLAATCPATPIERLAQLSIGQRDARLLALREALFGPHLVSVADCPACGERLELRFAVADIRADASTATDEELAVQVAGYQVRFRLPTTLDVAAASDGAPGEARQRLLARCLRGVTAEGEVWSGEALPEAVIAAVAARMAEVDPQAEVALALTCPACAHGWQAPFDIVSFLWDEVHAWASRLLREVHLLAATYGWHEQDILQMSGWRRQRYLELIRG